MGRRSCRVEWLSSMAKLDELASKGSSPSLQSVSQRRPFRLRRDWDLLAVLLLVLASMPAGWFSPQTLVVSSTEINLIDDSWLLDTSFKASRGIWFGRDVVCTYGPLFQWLSSAPARWMGPSMGAIYATYSTLPLWCMFLLGYLTLRLLLPEQSAWKRFLLLLLLSVYWASWEGRTAFATFLLALFLRGSDAVLRFCVGRLFFIPATPEFMLSRPGCSRSPELLWRAGVNRSRCGATLPLGWRLPFFRWRSS